MVHVCSGLTWWDCFFLFFFAILPPELVLIPAFCDLADIQSYAVELFQQNTSTDAQTRTHWHTSMSER